MSEKTRTCESHLATRPLLYSDSLGGKQVLRDDMWAVTTEELNAQTAALAQARAELEAAKGEGAEDGRTYSQLLADYDAMTKAHADLQAKLAAAEIELAAALGTLDMERDHLKIAESQAAELRRALEKIRTWAAGDRSTWGIVLDNIEVEANVTLNNLHASVQARAEREKAVEKIAAMLLSKKNGNGHFCFMAFGDKHDPLCVELTRLAALDSAQKAKP